MLLQTVLFHQNMFTVLLWHKHCLLLIGAVVINNFFQMKSWVDNRGYAGNVLHELVQCNFLQWMECLFYDCRVSFSDLEVTSRLIRISILEGELLYSQRKVFSWNYMYFHLSVSCWNWMQHVHRYQYQFCVALISELCYCRWLSHNAQL